MMVRSRRRGVVLAVLAAATVAAGARASAQELVTNGNERLANGSFSTGAVDPWWMGSNVTGQISSGALCVLVAGGTVNPWDAIFGQSQIPLELNQAYKLTFDAWADQPVTVKTTVQLDASPYTATLDQLFSVGTSSQRYAYDFTSSVAADAGGVTFQLGGMTQSYTICFDNVSLLGGQGSSQYVPDTGPALRVNQVGYVPLGPKWATWVTDATDAQTWQLLRADGKVAATGKTKPFGADGPSGDKVQLIDFSTFHGTGKGFTLSVGTVVSYPFDVSPEVYAPLRRAALEFFYHQRSGTPIESKYVGDAYARPAGHLGVLPNLGDTSVPCLPGTCDYALDVRGGWYDAGDQGKYVVNGGIATWQLVNTYERGRLWEHRADGDGTQQIPESRNGVPDILDEARWEMEFLLRMQVPEGQSLAGMAHHRMHDDAWTGFPMRPDQDPQPRHLHPPSTAATLNLAATAAQCARVWTHFDQTFAHKCLVAAEKAWAAAVAHPAVLATASPGGGGDYGDETVADEFYWAASELFATTGKHVYREFLTSSPDFMGKGITADGIYWGDVAALGDLTLAYVPNALPPPMVQGIRKAIVSAADKLLATMQAQGYQVPYLPADGKYAWGSNGQILNQIVLLAAAYDFTWNPKYRIATFQAMDYVLGRNALNMSYVTGFGTKFAQNEHHRFWCHQSDASYPHPPAGALAGGPNSFLQDSVIAAKLQGCAAAKCYIDDNQAYSANEVAINWNSALAWVAAWLDDRSK